jgi:hypothetical protein
MNPNTAQLLVLSYYGDVYRSFPTQKPEGTQPKKRRPRRVWDAQRFSARRGSRPPVFGGRV